MQIWRELIECVDDTNEDLGETDLIVVLSSTKVKSNGLAFESGAKWSFLMHYVKMRLQIRVSFWTVSSLSQGTRKLEDRKQDIVLD